MAAEHRFTRSLANHVINPVVVRSAGFRDNTFALVRYRGRKSGKSYQTPLIVRRTGDDFTVALTYGRDTQWFKNVRAAGECELVWHGEQYHVGAIELLSAEDGLAAFPFPMSPILRLRGTKDFTRFIVDGAPTPAVRARGV
jgi:deazaflavin-dependent oxidoreductase (nitroreductase family)